MNLNIFRLNKEDWKTSLFKIRSILSSHNTIYETNNEINPRFFLSFLLGRLNKELNLKKGSYQNPFKSLFSAEKPTSQRCSRLTDYCALIKADKGCTCAAQPFQVIHHRNCVSQIQRYPCRYKLCT